MNQYNTLRGAIWDFLALNPWSTSKQVSDMFPDREPYNVQKALMMMKQRGVLITVKEDHAASRRKKRLLYAVA